MATKQQMYALIGRMVADPSFRASLVEDPEKAVKHAGYDLTEEQMAALKEHDLKALSADLDERLSKEAHWDFAYMPW
jgi:nucleoid-associated protein YejK